MKTQILILAAAVLVASCSGNRQQRTGDTTVQSPDMHTAETSLDYQGLYKGTIPAADCPGIEVTLRLNTDGTYEQLYKYIDRDSQFDQKGNYTVEENLLTLDGEMPSYLQVEENRLRMLDSEKQPITGPLETNYILTKTE